MASKYDSIETAVDLIREVRNNGLSVDQNDINRAADIFGRSSIEELDRLANDIGRNNDKGEPDPEGTWSSNRLPTQSTFYLIAFSIWSWEQATRFYNEHTNPQTKGRRVANLEKSLIDNEKERDTLTSQLDATKERAKEYAYKIDDLNAEKASLEMEIVKLKAALYDLTIGKIA